MLLVQPIEQGKKLVYVRDKSGHHHLWKIDRRGIEHIYVLCDLIRLVTDDRLPGEIIGIYAKAMERVK